MRALSRARIVATALGLLERDGLPGLSMRRLASELGVSPMSPYRYFRDKDELIDAVIDAVASSEPLPETRGDWRRRVRDLMHWLFAGLSRYPGLIGLRLERPFLSPEALRLTEAALQALVEGGFTKAEALRAYRALLVYTFGSAAFGSHAPTEEVRRKTGAALFALPEDQYPILSGSIVEAAETASEGPFEHGLECLLDGLEASLERKSRRSVES